MSDDLPPEPNPPADRQERAPRTNLLLVASIDSDTIKGAVRIRNLSSGGALLEGGAFPRVGERLTLHRADLKVGATIAWRDGPRCGIRFDHDISVTEWSATGRSASTGQARVDGIQAAIRRGIPPPLSSEPATNEQRPAANLDHRLAEELAYVRRLLEAVGDALADDPAMVQRHGAALQGFDLADQILGHLGTVLTADSRDAAIDAIGMDDLRTRLTRKAIF